MMLYEEGRFQLDDPVAKYIPEWADLEVFDRGTRERYATAKPAAPMTIKHLLSHTAGLTYGFAGDHPVDALYREAQVNTGTLRDMVAKLAKLPLKFSPGTQWNYSVATDVCGHLVEHFSGRALDEFVAERITGPLGMKDSGFQVRPAAAERFAACYQFVKPAAFRLQDDPQKSRYHRRPAFLSGGGGMVGTIDDYHTFARMLLGKGELGGARLLGRKTVEYMATNHLPGNCDLAAMGQPVFSETPYEGIGFGLGFSVVVDPAAANVLDSPGEFAWGGAASTYFWIDPVEEVIAVFITQLLPSSSYPIRRELKTLVYQALV
jgi:CubicO group peptidase (beta-lactamase class C family)